MNDRTAVRRIVVPVLAGMGNALMAQPMIRQLAAAHDGADLVVFARNRSIAGVFERLNDVTRVEVFGNEPRQFARLLRQLRRYEADLLVVPYPSNRWQYSLLACLADAKRVVLHTYPVGRVRALHGLVGNRVATVEGRHDVLTNLDLLPPLAIEPDVAMPPTLPLSAGDLENAKHQLSAAVSPHDAGPGPRLCAIHAGSGATVFALSKRWPPEQYARLVPRLRARGLTPILLEGPEDAGVGDLIRSHVDLPLVPLAGPLHEAAAVLAVCDLYVGSDSGLAHLAAAVGTPPVALFGPARPDEVSPFGYRHLVVQTPATCAPCFDYPHRRTTPHVRCKPPYCVGQISVEAVLQAVDRVTPPPA